MKPVIDESGALVTPGDGPPPGWQEISKGMSNFDHSIDEGFAEALRSEGVFGKHAAWNFNGRVWHQYGQFHEQVWVYGTPVRVISADSLADLMAEVNAEFGWD